jgi:peroxiredoxin family protein
MRVDMLNLMNKIKEKDNQCDTCILKKLCKEVDTKVYECDYYKHE